MYTKLACLFSILLLADCQDYVVDDLLVNDRLFVDVQRAFKSSVNNRGQDYFATSTMLPANVHSDMTSFRVPRVESACRLSKLTPDATDPTGVKFVYFLLCGDTLYVFDLNTNNPTELRFKQQISAIQAGVTCNHMNYFDSKLIIVCQRSTAADMRLILFTVPNMQFVSRDHTALPGQIITYPRTDFGTFSILGLSKQYIVLHSPAQHLHVQSAAAVSGNNLNNFAVYFIDASSLDVYPRDLAFPNQHMFLSLTVAGQQLLVGYYATVGFRGRLGVCLVADNLVLQCQNQPVSLVLQTGTLVAAALASQSTGVLYFVEVSRSLVAACSLVISPILTVSTADSGCVYSSSAISSTYQVQAFEFLFANPELAVFAYRHPTTGNVVATDVISWSATGRQAVTRRRRASYFTATAFKDIVAGAYGERA